MENAAEISLADHYSAALDWWRDAGVDCDFADEAQSWLAEADAAPSAATLPSARVPEVPPSAPPALSPTDIPGDLASFRAWWMDAGTPLPTGPNARIAPRGDAGGPIMLVAPMPEAGDSEMLLSGAQGRMLGNLARALGHEPENLYVASALPSYMPLPDWSMLQREGIGHALARHIELVQAERVILLGSRLPLLLGHAEAAPPENFAVIGDTPVLTTFAPDRLLDHPRQRARLWQRLLAWTA